MILSAERKAKREEECNRTLDPLKNSIKHLLRRFQFDQQQHIGFGNLFLIQHYDYLARIVFVEKNNHSSHLHSGVNLNLVKD